jgi:DNA-binding transcriptional ArsR family regulator
MASWSSRGSVQFVWNDPYGAVNHYTVEKGEIRLDIFLYRNIILSMPRAATTADVFNAIAEPRRREIIGLLVTGKEHAVGDLVLRLRMAQPAVSKHLGVLRKVGVVSVSTRGQHRLYRLNAKELKPVHDWVKTYERYWAHQLGQIKQRAELKMANQLAKQLTKHEEGE